MRNLFILIFILIGFVCKSQVVVDSVDAKIYVDRVQKIELDKQDLKDKTNRWVAKTFNNSNYVTRINNEDNILTKGAFDVGADFSMAGTTAYSPRKVEYTLDLKFKEGRYRIEISDLTITASGFPEPLELYFMNYDEFKKYNLEFAETYDGSIKKGILKRVNNDKKFKKDYKSAQAYYKEIIPQIVSKLAQIDLSLLVFLKDNVEKDDW